LHIALSPSAQRENCAQQPSAVHAQVCGSTNTEWQSVRASHASFVVTCPHGKGQAIAGQAAPEPGAPQPTKRVPPLQSGQVRTSQSVRARHDASSVINEHASGGGWQMPALQTGDLLAS
jgi:hypothetical protein